MLALSAPAYVVFGALMLFGAAVVVRSTFALVRHVGSLARAVGTANETLQAAAVDVADQASQAQQTAERIAERRRARRTGDR